MDEQRKNIMPTKGQALTVIQYLLHPEAIVSKYNEGNGWINGQFFIRGNDGEWKGFTQFHAIIHTLENKYHWDIQHSEKADEFGFKSYRINPEVMGQLFY